MQEKLDFSHFDPDQNDCDRNSALCDEFNKFIDYSAELGYLEIYQLSFLMLELINQLYDHNTSPLQNESHEHEQHVGVLNEVRSVLLQHKGEYLSDAAILLQKTLFVKLVLQLQIKMFNELQAKKTHKEELDVVALRILHEKSTMLGNLQDRNIQFQVLKDMLSTSVKDMFYQPVSFVMTDFWSDKTMLYKFSNLHGRLERLTHLSYDFYNYKTLVIGKDLYAFYSKPDQPISVFKYVNTSQFKSKLATSKQQRCSFSIANYNDEFVYITGGEVDAQNSTSFVNSSCWSTPNRSFTERRIIINSVLKFSLKKKTFTEDVPAMINARYDHGSAVAGHKLYVFGGH